MNQTSAISNDEAVFAEQGCRPLFRGRISSEVTMRSAFTYPNLLILISFILRNNEKLDV